VAGVPLPVDPVPPVLVPPVPVPVDPVLVDPVLVDPVFGPPDVVSVGLAVGPPVPGPVPGELDAGVAGVEEPPAGADEDTVAVGLAVLDGLAL
jgi:hypothetical protein